MARIIRSRKTKKPKEPPPIGAEVCFHRGTGRPGTWTVEGHAKQVIAVCAGTKVGKRTVWKPLPAKDANRKTATMLTLRQGAQTMCTAGENVKLGKADLDYLPATPAGLPEALPAMLVAFQDRYIHIPTRAPVWQRVAMMFAARQVRFKRQWATNPVVVTTVSHCVDALLAAPAEDLGERLAELSDLAFALRECKPLRFLASKVYVHLGQVYADMKD